MTRICLQYYRASTKSWRNVDIELEPPEIGVSLDDRCYQILDLIVQHSPGPDWKYVKWAAEGELDEPPDETMA